VPLEYVAVGPFGSANCCDDSFDDAVASSELAFVDPNVYALVLEPAR